MSDNTWEQNRKKANDAKARKKNKTGRHYNQGNQSAKKHIDKDEFEKLCQMQCTQEEICGFFEIDHKTLDRFCHETYNRSFSQVFKDKREGGKTSLRRAMWGMKDHNPTMAIWLSKQHLGMSDNPGNTAPTPDDKRDPISQSLEEIGKNL